MATLCENCDASSATIACDNCEMLLCSSCDGDMHKPAKMATHTRHNIPTKGNKASSESNNNNAASNAISSSTGSASSSSSSSSPSPPPSSSAAPSTPTPQRPPSAQQQQPQQKTMQNSQSAQQLGRSKSVQGNRAKAGTTQGRRSNSPQKLQHSQSQMLRTRSPSPSKDGEGGESIFDKLSKPKVFKEPPISPLFDDLKNCTFHPVISPESLKMVPKQGKFMERLEASVKLYIQKRHSTDGSGYVDPQATFQPHLNKFEFSEREDRPAKSNNFYERMAEDMKARREHQVEAATRPLHSFQPVISESSKKRAARITTPFLDRLKEDLDSRYDSLQQRREKAEETGFSFHPNPERIGKTQYSFNSFLGRMENDLQDRHQKYIDRCKQYGLPLPGEGVEKSSASPSKSPKKGAAADDD